MQLILAALISLCPSLALQPKDKPADPLSGPSATPSRPADAKPTLVRRDFNGKVERLERTPEESAADLLGLDEATRKKITDLMGHRAMILDDFVAKNLDLLTKFGQAAAAGNKSDLLSLLRETFDKLSDLRRGGPLEAQIAALLTPEQAKAFKAFIAEYYEALVAERQASPDEGEMSPDGKRTPPNRLAIMIDEHLKAFGKEIERAFFRSLYSGELLFQKIDEAVTLRPEQKARIRGWCAEFAEKGGQNPTEEQKRDLFLRILSALDAKQAGKAIEYLKKNK